MKKTLFFFILLSSFFSACTNHLSESVSKNTLDSLSEYCYTLLLNRQNDSLRIVAQNYMNAAPLYSRQFYKGRQFYINASFNEGDYDKVLVMLTETENMPEFKKYNDISCDYQYTRARAFQYSQRYPEAIEAFKKCLVYDDTDKKIQDNLLSSVLNAMTQLMNTYISADKAEEGSIWFRQLKDKPTPFIQRLAMRDLYSHLAFITMQANRTKEAYIYADSIFLLPLYKSSHEKLFRDYSYAASIFYNNPERREDVKKWLQEALNEADKNGHTAGLQWSTDMLATIYNSQGLIEKGTELQYRALELSRKRGDKSAESLSYSNLSLLYKNWEMYDEANSFADLAISTIKNTDFYMIEACAYKMKALILQAMNRPDSAIHYYKLSMETYSKLTPVPESQVPKAYLGSLLINTYQGDSLALGIKLLEEVIHQTEKDKSKSIYFYFLAKGLIKEGQVAKGEIMLDSMYTDMCRIKDAVYADGVLEYVVDHYISQGNSEKVMLYSSLYRKQMNIKYDEKISHKVTSAMIKFQTEKKEQELKLAKAELSIKNLRIKLFIVIIILLISSLTGGLLYYLHKRKLHYTGQLLLEQENLVALRNKELAESRLYEKEQLLANAIESLREANHHSEQMRELLDEFIEKNNNRESITNITPSIYREEGEIKFRRYFSQLYPGFLTELRSRIPNLTKREEILSMLIALGLNMDEISDILCIEKSSVKMSRYRLHKKIKTKYDDSLDELIKNILK